MFHLKFILKNQHSCSPNPFYLHKLCHSTGLFFLWGREGKREQGGDLTLVGKRKKVFFIKGALWCSLLLSSSQVRVHVEETNILPMLSRSVCMEKCEDSCCLPGSAVPSGLHSSSSSPCLP